MVFWLVPGRNKSFIRIAAILISVIELVLSIFLFSFTNHDTCNLVDFNSLSVMNSYFALNNLALVLIVLTTFITFLCILYNDNKILTQDLKKYFGLFFLLESSCVGFFLSNNLLLLYIFFEFSLLPIFLIINFWGGKDKIYAAIKMLLYTIFGSLFMLAAIIYLYNKFDTFSLYFLAKYIKELSITEQKYLWFAFFIAFVIKIPIFPVHSWLPEAHVQAPTAGSVFLAAILLKMGTFGIYKILIQFFPNICNMWSKEIYILSIISIFYAALAALGQNNIKKIIAYSSIAHMGFVLIGLFTVDHGGLPGASFQMVSHGLISAALFFCIGILYSQTKTLDIAQYGGFKNKIPKFAFLFLLFAMASAGLPMTSGFIGEFLIIVSSYAHSIYYLILLAISIFFSAYYILRLYQKTMLGKMQDELNVSNNNTFSLNDINCQELFILSCLASLIIIGGILPNILLNFLICK